MSKIAMKDVVPAPDSSGSHTFRKDGRKNAWWQRPKRTGLRLITVTGPDGKGSYLKKTPNAFVWIDFEDLPPASNERKF